MKWFIYLTFLAPVALAVPTESGAHLVGITQSTQTGLAEQGVAAAHGENALELTCPACNNNPTGGRCDKCGRS